MNAIPMITASMRHQAMYTAGYCPQCGDEMPLTNLKCIACEIKFQLAHDDPVQSR